MAENEASITRTEAAGLFLSPAQPRVDPEAMASAIPVSTPAPGDTAPQVPTDADRDRAWVSGGVEASSPTCATDPTELLWSMPATVKLAEAQQILAKHGSLTTAPNDAAIIPRLDYDRMTDLLASAFDDVQSSVRNLGPFRTDASWTTPGYGTRGSDGLMDKFYSLTSERTNKRRAVPSKQLPAEVLAHIFGFVLDATRAELAITHRSYIGTRWGGVNQSADVLRCRRVCKSWNGPAASNRVGSSHAAFIRSIDAHVPSDLASSAASPYGINRAGYYSPRTYETAQVEPGVAASERMRQVVASAPRLNEITPLFKAVTTAKTLESLTLLIPIAFEELECVLNALSNLRRLALSSVLDLSRNGTIASTQPHAALALRSLTVRPAHEDEVGLFRPAQLCWIIEPAIAARNFEEVPAPLHVAPHDGNFDFVLSHLSSLTRLTLAWQLTGSAFVSTVSMLSCLASLELHGTPVDTSAASFTSALEIAFSALEHLTLRGDLTAIGSAVGRFRHGAGLQNDWTGATLRQIQQIAETRGIECTIAAETSR
ncbi:hypothetical protein Rhopal_000083-T1 [Rhodotorula paludigena]|uniref:F-box domain-containing protein n=1 Tax=Rhodotorula paludigena TaxID=86838 RepID=A0AAV5G9W3_9BASI|nr:hypothetical protein Rhopal_000083-T1 [Rhodotorula paludigena]